MFTLNDRPITLEQAIRYQTAKVLWPMCWRTINWCKRQHRLAVQP